MSRLTSREIGQALLDNEPLELEWEDVSDWQDWEDYLYPGLESEDELYGFDPYDYEFESDPFWWEE